jgi:steroid delta-isomerase-like uncharacterized protein
MPLSPEQVARTWFNEVWNNGSEQAIDRLMAPNAAFHGLTPPGEAPIVGPAGFKPFFRRFREAFPDIHIDIDQLVCQDDRVALHCTVTGTHRGGALGVAPTNRPMKFTGMGMARIVDGKIVEAWNAFDFGVMYKQLGITPPL